MFGKTRISPQRPWLCDPLSHPDIARMTERERADLPWDAARICSAPVERPAGSATALPCQARP